MAVEYGGNLACNGRRRPRDVKQRGRERKWGRDGEKETMGRWFTDVDLWSDGGAWRLAWRRRLTENERVQTECDRRRERCNPRLGFGPWPGFFDSAASTLTLGAPSILKFIYLFNLILYICLTFLNIKKYMTFTNNYLISYLKNKK